MSLAIHPDGTGKVCPQEIDPFETGTREIRLAQIRIEELRTAEIRTPQDSALEIGAGQVRKA